MELLHREESLLLQHIFQIQQTKNMAILNYLYISHHGWVLTLLFCLLTDAETMKEN